MLILDGSEGEGGGQILRTALSLSMLTGLPFRIEKIRAKRRKPGLLRQHLTCVTAAAKVSGATVVGAELGSLALVFTPGAIRGGTYDFAIGSAGSTMLVFQTVLPALLRADAPSRVTISGGTHNPNAPTFDHLERAFLPLLRRMGAAVSVTLQRHGFYPAGGGRWQADITPSADLRPLHLEAAGDRVSQSITAAVANLPFEIAEREAGAAAALLSWPRDTATACTVKAEGQGNVVSIEIAHEHVTEIFSGFGERGKSAEAVASEAVEDARAYLSARVPVGPHLCDQLLLPCAMAGSATFVTSAPTQHTRTNIAVIEKFLPVEIELSQLDVARWRVKL